MKITQKDAIRRLQKDGEYRFQGLSREESKKAAMELAKAAMKEDRKYGIEKKLYELADRIFVNVQGRGDLETHRCGDHDFFEAAIWELKTALTEAYELGRSSK